jgi:hypothetical protein
MAIITQPAGRYLEPDRDDKIGRHLTPPHLIDSGMKRCDECGELAPIESKTCLDCGAFIVMFVDRYNPNG